MRRWLRGERGATAWQVWNWSWNRRQMSPAPTRPDFREQAKALEGLHRLQLPDKEDSAVGVVKWHFADRGLVCTEDEVRRILREGTFNRG